MTKTNRGGAVPGGLVSYISVLTVISALAVVILHTNGCFWSFSYERYWVTANIIECVFYFAVPVFFMITGATLIDYRERYSTAEYFKKRAMRALLPFVFWSLVGACWVYATSGTAPGSLADLINRVLNTNYISIFWFFPSLFAVYLAIPFISLVPKEARRMSFGYAIVAAALTISILPLVFGLVGISWPGALQFPAAGGYLLYVLIGYWVANYDLTWQQRCMLYIAGCVGLLAHIIGTQILSYQAGEVVRTFKGYLNAPCLFYSVAIFVAARYLEGSKLMDWAYSTVGRLSGLAFGVYLLQFFFLQVVSLYTSIDTHSIVYRLGGGMVIFALCAAATWLIKKIPVLKRLVG